MTFLYDKEFKKILNVKYFRNLSISYAEEYFETSLMKNCHYSQSIAALKQIRKLNCN